MSVDDQVVLITGASRGIGRELALRLAGQRARIVVNYRRDGEAAEEVASEIADRGGEAVTIAADIGDEASIDELMDRVRDRFGRLDLLVANAAASAFKPLEDIRGHHVHKTMAITVEGFLHLVRAGVPLMPGGGRIVAISGWDSFRVLPGHGLLGAAKAAMETLVRYLAVELAPRGVGVVGVCPGPVDTDSFRFYAGDDWVDYEREWLGRSPYGRFPTPAEIAEVVEFFGSPASAWITGQTVVVDGGLSLTTMPSGTPGLGGQ